MRTKRFMIPFLTCLLLSIVSKTCFTCRCAHYYYLWARDIFLTLKWFIRIKIRWFPLYSFIRACRFVKEHNFKWEYKTFHALLASTLKVLFTKWTDTPTCSINSIQPWIHATWRSQILSHCTLSYIDTKWLN